VTRAAAAPLALLLADAESSEHRFFARLALAKLGADAVPVLAPLLSHRDSAVRADAAWSLASSPTPRARDALLQGTRSPDSTVRAHTTGGLCRLRDSTLAPVLVDLTRDASPYVRETAVTCLAGVYQPAFRRRLGWLACCDADLLVRYGAAEALTRQTTDPVAQRIGGRYRPLDLSPATESARHAT
jgi:hypothetical protein